MGSSEMLSAEAVGPGRGGVTGELPAAMGAYWLWWNSDAKHREPGQEDSHGHSPRGVCSISAASTSLPYSCAHMNAALISSA